MPDTHLCMLLFLASSSCTRATVDSCACANASVTGPPSSRASCPYLEASTATNGRYAMPTPTLNPPAAVLDAVAAAAAAPAAVAPIVLRLL